LGEKKIALSQVASKSGGQVKKKNSVDDSDFIEDPEFNIDSPKKL
jgi:hypothetical protein